MKRPTPADLYDWCILKTRAGYVNLKTIEAIRCNATGEIRERESYIVWYDHDADGPHTFIWSDGNFACDCNRALFFAQMGGEPDPNVKCARGAFSVQLKNAKTGEVFYDEFEDCNT